MEGRERKRRSDIYTRWPASSVFNAFFPCQSIVSGQSPGRGTGGGQRWFKYNHPEFLCGRLVLVAEGGQCLTGQRRGCWQKVRSRCTGKAESTLEHPPLAQCVRHLQRPPVSARGRNFSNWADCGQGRLSCLSLLPSCRCSSLDLSPQIRACPSRCYGG